MSKGSASLKRSNAKLHAQKVSSFEGKGLKWHSWKKKLCAVVGTEGMLRILDSAEYATRNTVDIETVFIYFK